MANIIQPYPTRGVSYSRLHFSGTGKSFEHKFPVHIPIHIVKKMIASTLGLTRAEYKKIILKQNGTILADDKMLFEYGMNAHGAYVTYAISNAY